jgi:anti-sigma B factor antagonist
MKEILIEGRVTVDNSNDMRCTLDKALRSKPGIVTVDLSRVTYMDSSGLATLLEATGKARKQGTRLLLRGLQGQVCYFFKLSHLRRLFEIEEEKPA